MRLGVDFGTTRTTVSAVDRGNYPVVAFHDEFDDVQEYIPSLVALDGDHPVFGFRARDLAVEGTPHLRSIKRFLADPATTATTTVRVGHRDLNLLGLVRGFLAEVARSVRNSSSVAEIPADEPLEAVVGVPAHAHSAQRLLTLDAFHGAGFTVTAMLNEPSAAGLEYTHRHASTITSRRGSVLVYDLGGGTFDASLVAVDGADHEVLGSRGNNLLGGDDFDVVLAQLVADSAGTTPAELGERAWMGLVDAAREAKESLSPQTRFVTLEVDERPISIPTAAFYEAVRPLIDSTIDTMNLLITGDDAASAPQAGGTTDLAGIYVVGGGSELPAIPRALKEHYGRRVHRSPHTAASTAIGLALAADPDAGYTLRERLSRGVGVFRERESGSLVSFDMILSPQMRVSTSQSVTVTRSYRAAHNIGWFRFVEYTTTDEDGVPRGGVVPVGDLVMPFDRLLQGLDDTVDLRTLDVRRTENGPMVQERYTVDPHGIVEVSVTDLDTGFVLTRSLGESPE